MKSKCLCGIVHNASMTHIHATSHLRNLIDIQAQTAGTNSFPGIKAELAPFSDVRLHHVNGRTDEPNTATVAGSVVTFKGLQRGVSNGTAGWPCSSQAAIDVRPVATAVAGFPEPSAAWRTLGFIVVRVGIKMRGYRRFSSCSKPSISAAMFHTL
ncbi:MAG: hypothetical protein EOO81_04060 [Oxalobacteraceae bacterium]|nr:MAG: hypothetical protein EOO81_04060 [Oxalobacteraceae bacterium]